MTVATSVSSLSEMAIAEEATAGTAETTPVLYDYFTGDPAVQPVQDVIELRNVYGRDPANTVLGGYHTTGTIPQMVDPDGAVGWWLKWFMGTATASQMDASTAYQHTFTPSDTLKTFTFWFKYGGTLQTKSVNNVVNTFKLSQATSDALKMEVGILGGVDATASDFGSSSYSTTNVFTNSMLTVSISGATTGQAAQVFNSVIQGSNNFDENLGRVHGQRDPKDRVPGKRNVTGSFEMWFNDDSEYQKFWGSASATTPAATATAVPLIYTWDLGEEAGTSHNYELEITLPAVKYRSTAINVGGDRVVQKIDWVAEKDSYVMQITVTNKITEYADAT